MTVCRKEGNCQQSLGCMSPSAFLARPAQPQQVHIHEKVTLGEFKQTQGKKSVRHSLPCNLNPSDYPSIHIARFPHIRPHTPACLPPYKLPSRPTLMAKSVRACMPPPHQSWFLPHTLTKGRGG